MSDTKRDIAGLMDLMTKAIDAVRPSGVFSSTSKLSAALFALYEAMPALTALQAERDAALVRLADVEECLDAAEKDNRISDNGNMWRFWAYKAREVATKNDKLKARAEAAEADLIRAKVGLVLARDELDQYSRQEYPLDHPVQVRYRKRDYEANPARLALDALTPPADLAKGVADE